MQCYMIGRSINRRKSSNCQIKYFKKIVHNLYNGPIPVCEEGMFQLPVNSHCEDQDLFQALCISSSTDTASLVQKFSAVASYACTEFSTTAL